LSSSCIYVLLSKKKTNYRNRFLFCDDIRYAFLITFRHFEKIFIAWMGSVFLYSLLTSILQVCRFTFYLLERTHLICIMQIRCSDVIYACWIYVMLWFQWTKRLLDDLKSEMCIDLLFISAVCLADCFSLMLTMKCKVLTLWNLSVLNSNIARPTFHCSLKTNCC